MTKVARDKVDWWQRRQVTGHAYMLLVQARKELRKTGAHQAAAYVSRALKSVDGANRHAVRMHFAYLDREGQTLRDEERRRSAEHDNSCGGTLRPPMLPGVHLWICEDCSTALDGRYLY